MTLFNTLDKYWLAGLFEGEACFSLAKGKLRKDGKRRLTATLQVNMIDPDVMNRVATLLNATCLGPYPGRSATSKEFYVIHISGTKAVAIMTQLLPIMGERRTKRILQVITQHGILIDS